VKRYVVLNNESIVIAVREANDGTQAVGNEIETDEKCGLGDKQKANGKFITPDPVVVIKEDTQTDKMEKQIDRMQNRIKKLMDKLGVVDDG